MRVQVLGLFSIAFSWIWGGVQRTLHAVDRSLVWLAIPFGVNVKNPSKRYAVLLGIYGAIYLITLLPVPVLPLVALAIGYIGILAVGRAWVLNENQRNAIAKGLAEGKPDEMPDLRGVALVSALQLFVLFPLLFQHAQKQFGLYRTPPDANFWTWVLFTVESYNKALLSLPEVYGIRLSPHIESDSSFGRHLVILNRLTFDFLLIQAVIRLFAIRSMIREVVEMTIRMTREQVQGFMGMTYSGEAAVDWMGVQGNNPIMRLGRRSVGLLIEHLRDADPVVRSMAAAELHLLKDRRVVPYLVCLLSDPAEQVVEAAINAAAALLTEDDLSHYVLPLVHDGRERVRSAALEILSRAKDTRAIDPLVRELTTADVGVRRTVTNALSRFQDRRIVEPLIKSLNDADPVVRGNAAVGLGLQNDTRAIDPLIQSLQHESIVYAALRIVESLSRLRATVAVEPLLQLLSQCRDNGVRIAIIEALGRLKDRRAVGTLLKYVKKKNADVRAAAIHALGELGDAEGFDTLANALKDDGEMIGAGNVRAVAAEALGELKDPRGVDLLIPLLHDQDEDMRANVAAALGKIGDSRAVQPLLDLLQRESHPYVRGKVTDALKLLDAASATQVSADPHKET